MYYLQSWSNSAVKLLSYFLVFFVLGLYFDETILFLAIGGILLLVFNYFQLFLFTKWLWQSRSMSPPEVRGIWRHIYDGIYHLQRRNRNKRKNLGQLVKRFREGAEALPDAVVVIDKSAQILWCNRNARIELGLKWPDDNGRRIDNLIRNPTFIDYLQNADFQFPIEIPAPTNPMKTFEYRIMQYGDDQLLMIVRDVSRVSHLEEMRKDFVANVSHELKTPLTVINGYLEVIDTCASDAPPILEKAVAEMGEQTQRMQSLIEDLLILSRIEASSERIFEKIIDMPAMIQRIGLEAAALNKTKKHDIIYDIDDDLTVFGVETEMRSACSNLLFNAIHYTPPKGVIKVIWRKQVEGAFFAVIDNGDGIEDKHLRRLTERFYRVDKARSRKTGGSGLGLSIVKHVLHHHNSVLDVQSKVGKGSEFSFTLPNELISEYDFDD